MKKCVERIERIGFGKNLQQNLILKYIEWEKPWFMMVYNWFPVDSTSKKTPNEWVVEKLGP